MFYTLLITGILIFFDQIAKAIIVNKLKENQSVTLIPRFFSFVSLRNKGGAYGFLNGQTSLFIIISIIVTTVFGYLLIMTGDLINDFYFTVTLILVIAGTCGNLSDRIIRGEVVDFLALSIFGKNLPVFNFADLYLGLGMTGLIITELL